MPLDISVKEVLCGDASVFAAVYVTLSHTIFSEHSNMTNLYFLDVVVYLNFTVHEMLISKVKFDKV